MALGMYDASVPNFLRVMKAMTTILDKGQSHAETKKIDPAALLTARLFPDMFNFTRQVQSTTAMVQWACALLAGLERPDVPNTETTFDELKARVVSTIDYAKTFTPERINGSETRDVKLVFPRVTLEFTGQSYLFEFALPNVYFHATAAYSILRHNGVEVGKTDFLARG